MNHATKRAIRRIRRSLARTGHVGRRGSQRISRKAAHEALVDCLVAQGPSVEEWVRAAQATFEAVMPELRQFAGGEGAI